MAVAAGLAIGMIGAFQTHMLFPTSAVPAAGPLPKGARQVSTQSAEGTQLHGVHVPRPRGSGGVKTLVLGFGGNAWNGSDVAVYLHSLYPDAEVVAFHYRGYHPSAGTASSEALLADAPLVHDFARALTKPERTIVVGFSIGSGVAARLAESGSPDGLILVTPFDSLKAAASDLFPWLPIGPFFTHEMNAAGMLAGRDVPVAIIAAEHDSVIVPARTEALRKQVDRLVFDRTIRGAGHNDIYARSDFQAAMRDALQAVTASKHSAK